ncbi:unnamed protein product [Protopolystoma xenopodis]|uniref:Uncharacterized protein n=1 Tax=Protopolystoma xenopodis TaxID=117903 RepID=A0A448XPP1_9PLAT|nr:unnamed protein product [Protopolystoma xenopodis]
MSGQAIWPSQTVGQTRWSQVGLERSVKWHDWPMRLTIIGWPRILSPVRHRHVFSPPPDQLGVELSVHLLVVCV